MEGIINLGNYINPFHEDFLGYKIINGIGSFFTGDEEEGTTGVFGFLSSIGTGIGNIVSFIGDFFDNLLHLFVPTTAQWNTIKTRFSGLSDIITAHLPFVSTFKTSLEIAQNSVVSNSDMLVITMPSFSFYGGQTQQQRVVNVRNVYEPYRVQIRTGLTYIVYGLGLVYIIKYILGWGQTQASTEVKESGQYMSWARRK